MKETWKPAMVVALALCAFAWTGAEAGDRSFGDGTLPDYLAIYDVDGDGTLSVEEVQAMREARQHRHRDWIEQWDTNEDGMIDDEERMAAREELRRRIIHRRTMRFREADADGDGCLTFVEFSAIPAVMKLAEEHPEAPARIFDRLDINDDNCISLEEFLRHLRHRRNDGWRTREVYVRADGGPEGDRCLTLEEFRGIPAMRKLAEQRPEAPTRIYNHLDADDNECLTLEEFLSPLHLGEPPEPWTPADVYAKIDANGDECVSLDEWRRFPPMVRLAETHPEGPARIYGELDANGDECLTLREFIEGRQHEDPALDVDGA